MKKNMQKTVAEFLSLEPALRNELFSREYDVLPNMDSRARLFLALPIEESARILSEVDNFSMNDVLLEKIRDMSNTETFLFSELLPKISPVRLVKLILESNAVFNFGSFENIIFNLLPIETVVAVINEGVCENEFHHQESEYISKKLELIEPEKLIILLEKLKVESIKRIVEQQNGSGLGIQGRQRALACISILENNKRIVKICLGIQKIKAVAVLNAIKDVEKQKQVLKLLPQEYRDIFFNKTSKAKKTVLRESEIDVTKLSMSAKKNFFKKFPKSKQVAKLTITEKIEIFA